MIPSRCEFSKTTGIRDKHERVTRLPLLHTPHLVFLPTKDNVNLINKSTEVKGWTYLWRKSPALGRSDSRDIGVYTDIVLVVEL